MPSLREIEQTVSTLWLDKEARAWLLSGRKGKCPASLNNAPVEVLQAVDQRGVELYGDLMGYGHHDVMESIYPHCGKLLGRNWDEVVDDYLRRFPPDHFNFNRLCNKLSQYFTEYGGTWTEKYPYLAELADYEWIELEKMEEDTDVKVFPHQEITELDQITSLRPVVNPTATVRNYCYNVMDIAARLESGRRPGKVKPAQTYVAVYRHPETHLCKFVELGEASARIVEAARENVSYQQLIPLAVSLLPDTDPQQALVQFLELIEDLQELRVFVGSVPVS